MSKRLGLVVVLLLQFHCITVQSQNAATQQTEFNTETSLGALFKPWRFFITWIIPTAIILILLQHAGCI